MSSNARFLVDFEKIGFRAPISFSAMPLLLDDSINHVLAPHAERARELFCFCTRILKVRFPLLETLYISFEWLN